MKSRTTFTPEMDAIIKANYLEIPVKRLGRMIGKSYTGISGRLKQLGLVIPREIIEERKKMGRIKKGDPSFNKGKKQKDYMSAEAIERTKKTRFQKGNKPHNTAKNNGAISIRPDTKSGIAYKYIRVSLGVWELYHRVVWEQNNGEIPENHVIAFKDGDSMNCNIKNLELLTMRENMLRNSLVRFPEPVRKTQKLIWDINYKIQQNG